MDKQILTLDDCMTYVIEQMNIGNPNVWGIFEQSIDGPYITNKTYEKVARILYIAYYTKYSNG
jgi:hypothetical protein